MEGMMPEVQREEWMARVQQTFARLKLADRDAQDAACEEMEGYAGEAAIKLREMFEGERARLMARAGEISAKLDAAVEGAQAPKDEAKPEDEGADTEKPKGWEGADFATEEAKGDDG